MSKEKITQHYGFLPSDSEGINSLAELALDLSWSWNHATDELWELLDADMWQLTHNPWIVLQTVSRDKLERQLADTSFQQKMKELLTAKELAAADDSWFQKKYSATTLRYCYWDVITRLISFGMIVVYSAISILVNGQFFLRLRMNILGRKENNTSPQ